ncbi:Uncharacterised protein r2_g2618 [Pycnogonum litorale]
MLHVDCFLAGGKATENYYRYNVNIGGTTIRMAVDTGSAATILTRWLMMQPYVPLQLLTSFPGNEIKCLGEAKLHVKIGTVTELINCRVVDDSF